MTRDTKIRAEEWFPITGQVFASGKYWMVQNVKFCWTWVPQSPTCQILLFAMQILHALPKFSSNTQRIHVGNGQYVSVLFVIPLIIDIHGHRFEIVTLVSEIHDNVDLVLGMKNIFELEGMIDSWDSCFSFLSRSIKYIL